MLCSVEELLYSDGNKYKIVVFDIGRERKQYTWRDIVIEL